MSKIIISGFADEICNDFEEQLKVVTKLGMDYISLRTANGKGIADYTVNQVQNELLPLLNSYGVKVSSLGSPIGKIKINDDEAFNKQTAQLKELCKICKLLSCKFIRIFSFYMSDGAEIQSNREQVMQKLRLFADIAEKENIVLIHENEKEIYGDTALRCKDIFDSVNSPSLKAAFDFANFVQCGENTRAAWELLQNEAVYIHIKDAVYDDSENVLCGTGEGNIELLLSKAFKKGYKGFLTLEPHLFLFDALKNLETADAKDIIKQNKAKTGAQAYEMQYEALKTILTKIN